MDKSTLTATSLTVLTVLGWVVYRLLWAASSVAAAAGRGVPVRARPANAAVLASLTVLALVIAPVCAPFCAAKSCASGARQEQCHDMATAGADGQPQLVAPGKACGVGDFSAVLVKPHEEYLLSQGARNPAAPVILNGAPELGLESFGIGPRRRGAHPIPLESSDSLLLTTVLRM
jgi:hypothetical protein